MAQLKNLLLFILFTPYSLGNKLLEDPILRIVDGTKGIFDAEKVQNTLWLIREISYIHQGEIKLKDGVLDPRLGSPTKIMFRGKEQTLGSLIMHETFTQKLSPDDQKELARLFRLVKDYFAVVNNIMIADARGAQEFMIKLIKEFCRKHNRPQSILLHWNKNMSEAEMYEKDVTSFKVLHEFTSDLMNFLAVLVKSCPKAFAQFKSTHPSSSKAH